jgi:hypothetical protein
MEGICEFIEKQLRTDDREWSSSLGFGRGVNNSSVYKIGLAIQQIHGLILYYELNNGMSRIGTGGRHL